MTSCYHQLGRFLKRAVLTPIQHIGFKAIHWMRPATPGTNTAIPRGEKDAFNSIFGTAKTLCVR